MTQSNCDHNSVIGAATSYIEDLGWCVIPVAGKIPVWKGWPDLETSAREIARCLEANQHFGIGLNLGRSGLLDLEADTEEGEARLDDLCKGIEFPCWRSSRGKHRLFQCDSEVAYLKTEATGIEFRTDRHQSVLPPSPHPSGKCRYTWLVSPLDVQPPKLPEHIKQFYAGLSNEPGVKREPKFRILQSTWQYRDQFDFVLRHFDLLNKVVEAGLEVCTESPDRNGNIPCHVPAILRNGAADSHPSGIFNIHNGVLRDFSTGQNHLYFRLMEALTGEPWLEILQRYEKKAGSVHGRPHSRRIAIPIPTATSTEERQSLDQVRESLGKYFQEQLARPIQPKTLHLIKGMPGLGKTYGLCKSIAEAGKKAIILTLENSLASHHLTILRKYGGNSTRMPVLRQSPCPHPDEYESTSRRGFAPNHGLPCGMCRIGPKSCPYLLGFQDLESADQLCCAAIYHTHNDFYTNYGNENRGIVVFDENAVDLLLAPISHNLDSWLSWGKLLGQRTKEGTKAEQEYIASIQMLIDWLKATASSFATAKDEANSPVKFQVFPLPKELHQPEMAKLPHLQAWLNGEAFKTENKHVPNLYDPAVWLLKEPNALVLMERIATKGQDTIVVRFRKNNPLPEGKEVFLLDATANEELIRAIAPGWTIKVFEPPKVEQKGRIIQIMDYDVSRGFIKQKLGEHATHNPSWLVQIVDKSLAEKPAHLISFKNVVDGSNPEYGLIKKLNHGHRLLGTYNYPCRGHSFEPANLIVLGTPYKDQATIWELAVAIWGFDGLPKTQYQHTERIEEFFRARNMAYADEHLKPLEEFLISAELVQAIGRVRPLENDCTIYVLTNARVPEWEVEQFMSAELFDLQQPKRRDFAEGYSIFVDACLRRLNAGDSIKASVISRELQTADRTGRKYMSQFKADYKERIQVQGQSIRWLA